ncbi:hypothetical protein [Streptomyces sp. SID12501]|uniref:Uncharacterized protein n=1 Tax=Streptomyces sp. SID12501 TaxID=2706042 RepID=A0A6B3C5U6_9ACTN|nr:hypothetical protein [Streptomyces sp. SID12501]NEC92175.1 hypothetical protein [Streptomyces sp. SID12501]
MSIESIESINATTNTLGTARLRVVPNIQQRAEQPPMSAVVTALPEFELNSPELLYAESFVPDPDTGSVEISLNSQGNGQLFTPDQADDFANKVIVWGRTVKAMADAARDHNDDVDETDIYMPKLVRECERLGLALQLTDDPAIDLAEIRVIDGRRTLIARVDEVPVAYDSVHPVGRCVTCNNLLDDTALPFVPANAMPGYGGGKNITGEDIKICRPCVTASGLPLTAAQRGPEWMARWGCPGFCVENHGQFGALECHSTVPVETRMCIAELDSSGYSENGETLPWLSAQVIVTNDKPQAYGRKTGVWLSSGVHVAEISPAKAREALDAMRGFVARLAAVVNDAERIAANDFDGDPEIARLDTEATDARIKRITEASAAKP